MIFVNTKVVTITQPRIGIVVSSFFRVCLCLFALRAPGAPLSAQDRGASLTVTGGGGQQVARFGDARALVIGESDYTNGWARLSGVKDDVRAVQRLFEEQGFAVQTLENASGRALREGIEHFLDQYGHAADTRILIYYAGHGETLQLAGGKMGYIVPVDAPLPSSNREGFLRSALPMNQFQTWAEQYDCRHMIFIFDSCFSGTVFTTARGTPPVINENISRHTRQFITSGGENETVPDRSVFRTQLEAALREGEADLNRDGYVSGAELGMFLEDTVVNYSNATQRPKYGKLRNPSLDKGDFIFTAGNSRPAGNTPPPPVTSEAHTGSVTVTSEIAGMVLIDGRETGTRVKAQGSVTIANVSAGETVAAVRDDSGNITRAARNVAVRQGQTAAAAIERPRPADFVKIPGGTFMMGSPENEPERFDDEARRQATAGTFYMGKYEVTQKEWREVMGNNPSRFQGDNLPVERVSWYEAVEYCNKRSEREGLAPAYRIDKTGRDPQNTNENDAVKWLVTWDRNASGYRLPTEAEWEYACRAGTGGPFSTGNNITTDQANYDGHYPYNNNAKGVYREKTVNAGSFAANPWGLYDMHGNVWEWCWDWYESYSGNSQTDPAGPAAGSDRVLRGGSWLNFARNLRSANRGSYAPSDRGNDLGFRLVRP
ncbi:MAG: SUMF1/EgtB/PvdO family nonheme iron enzyme [Treponema sp.]|jgi:formylglycine-generating enzyme required for sulfatase activity|nr:SUMF1/EgtB/PvdO family nonheme iron enzyme [Treponema sp.]